MGSLEMQRLKLLAMLATGSCLVIGTIASAEPVSPQPTKKHAECAGSKVKTACNQQVEVTDFVKGRQATSTSVPTASGTQTAAAKSSQQVLESAKDDGVGMQPPK